MDTLKLTVVYETQAEAERARNELANAAARIHYTKMPTIAAIDQQSGSKAPFSNDLKGYDRGFPVWALTAEFNSGEIRRQVIVDHSVEVETAPAGPDSTASIILRMLGDPVAQRISKK